VLIVEYFHQKFKLVYLNFDKIPRKDLLEDLDVKLSSLLPSVNEPKF